MIDRDAYPPAIDRYRRLHERGALTVRLGISQHVETLGPLEQVLEEIRRVAAHPLRQGGPRLRIVGIKTYLDGGMLTGSAYMRQPWGVSRIYAIDDPELSRRAVHPSRAAGADRAANRPVGPAIYGSQRRRWGRARPARRL